jgi:hypothetical protein
MRGRLVRSDTGTVPVLVLGIGRSPSVRVRFRSSVPAAWLDPCRSGRPNDSDPDPEPEAGRSEQANEQTNRVVLGRDPGRDRPCLRPPIHRSARNTAARPARRLRPRRAGGLADPVHAPDVRGHGRLCCPCGAVLVLLDGQPLAAVDHPRPRAATPPVPGEHPLGRGRGWLWLWKGRQRQRDVAPGAGN